MFSPKKFEEKHLKKWSLDHPFLDFSVTFSEANVRFFLLGGITHGIHQNNQQHLHQVLSPKKWVPCNGNDGRGISFHGFFRQFFVKPGPYGPPRFTIHPTHHGVDNKGCTTWSFRPGRKWWRFFRWKSRGIAWTFKKICQKNVRFNNLF